MLRDRVFVSPSPGEHTDRWEGDCAQLLPEAAARGLLLPNARPEWMAHELVMTFAGRRTLTTSRTGTVFWDPMNDFWSGMLPLVATADWLAGWVAAGLCDRPRPDPDGLASLSPSVVAGAVLEGWHDRCP